MRENRRAKARPLQAQTRTNSQREDQTMKTKIPNALLVWKQFEDDVVPRLRLTITDRAVYYHLLRHTRLEGKLQLHFSLDWLARGTRLCNGAVRPAVGRLIDHGALRLVERTKAGHVVEVLLPDEVPAARPDPGEAREAAQPISAVDLEQVDFRKTKELRQAIYARDRGLCFYCLQQINVLGQCLDHVVPQAEFGRNSYRNLVSCCLECNSRKGAGSAADFLRRLCREGRLTGKDFSDRLRALDDLASGKLRPVLPAAV
jgi:hypothetical protein